MDQGKKIFSLLKQHHRGYHTGYCQRQLCFLQHITKIKEAIRKQEPLLFVLPAFPAKSTNKNKTIAPYPDRGEKISLIFLNNLCEEIKDIYFPGARLLICSDGRVFNDLLNIPDENVQLYTNDIMKCIQTDKLDYLKVHGLDNYYNVSTSSVRENLVNEYGDPLMVIRDRVKNNYHDRNMFNGIHRFIYEDMLANTTDESKNKIRERSKLIAYQVIQRSNAWSNLIEDKYPNAVRLSIHPQYCDAKKFGISLIKSKDVWATPWHRVVLQTNDDEFLIRKSEAEQLGAHSVLINAKFSHYKFEGSLSC